MAIGNFSIALQGFEKKTAQKMKTAIQQISSEAFFRIIMRTPVGDVNGGRLRGNWSCSIGSPYAGYDEGARDTSGSATAAKMMSVAKAWNGQGSIFLCNNVPYSIAIEYGHSRVKAPAGMVRVTITEMGGVVREAAK